MKTSTVDILLSIGIPAGVKGFNYICDAMEIFDSDPYYADGKICALYHDIAQKHNTTSSRSSALCVTHLKPPFSKAPRKK